MIVYRFQIRSETQLNLKYEENYEKMVDFSENSIVQLFFLNSIPFAIRFNSHHCVCLRNITKNFNFDSNSIQLTMVIKTHCPKSTESSKSRLNSVVYRKKS